MMELSFEVTLAQVQGLQAEIQLTKRKALLELFVSSFATILFTLPLVWFFLQTSLNYNLAPFRFAPSLLMLPLLINTSMWMAWIILSVIPIGSHYWPDPSGQYSDDEGVRSLYREYEWLRYSSLRAKRTERIIDLLTALEFVTISMTFMFLIQQSLRSM